MKGIQANQTLFTGMWRLRRMGFEARIEFNSTGFRFVIVRDGKDVAHGHNPATARQAFHQAIKDYDANAGVKL